MNEPSPDNNLPWLYYQGSFKFKDPKEQERFMNDPLGWFEKNIPQIYINAYEYGTLRGQIVHTNKSVVTSDNLHTKKGKK